MGKVYLKLRSIKRNVLLTLLVIGGVLLIVSGAFIFSHIANHKGKMEVYGTVINIMTLKSSGKVIYITVDSDGSEGDYKAYLLYENAEEFKAGDKIRAVCNNTMLLSDPPCIDAYEVYLVE